MTTESESDKRRYPRVSFLDPVQAVAIANPCRHWYLLAQDLSEGGLMLLAPEVLAVGERLLLGVEVDAVAEPIRAVGRVAWVAQAGCQDHYRVGIEFVEVDEVARQRLRELVGAKAAER